LKELGLNDRQIKALELMVNEKVTFTNNMYQKEFKISRFTASRDLKELVDKEQAYIVGKGKGTKYKAIGLHAA
jgi:ATP-dependent DNA helicase RecG